MRGRARPPASAKRTMANRGMSLRRKPHQEGLLLKRAPTSRRLAKWEIPHGKNEGSTISLRGAPTNPKQETRGSFGQGCRIADLERSPVASICKPDVSKNSRRPTNRTGGQTSLPSKRAARGHQMASSLCTPRGLGPKAKLMTRERRPRQATQDQASLKSKCLGAAHLRREHKGVPPTNPPETRHRCLTNRAARGH